MENIKYIGNAKMINSLEDLPKIGSKFDGLAVFKCYENSYCISINAFEYEDGKKEIGEFLPDAEAEKYLFFKVYFCETKGKYMSFGLDTFYFLYCIDKENIK